MSTTPQGNLLTLNGDPTQVANTATGAYSKVFYKSSDFVAMKPSGETLALLSGSTISLIKADNGLPISSNTDARLSGISQMQYTPQGNKIVTLRANRLDVWDSTTLLNVASWQVFPASSAMAISPDGLRVAVATVGDTVKMYTLQGGFESSLLQTLACSGKAIAFSPDGGTVAFAVQTSTEIELVRLGNFSWPHLVGHTNKIQAITYSPDGSKILSCGSNLASDPAGEVILWSASTNSSIRRHSEVPKATEVTFCRGGQTYLALTRTQPINQWNTLTGNPAPTIGPNGESDLSQFSADGTVVYGKRRFFDTFITVHSATTGELVREFSIGDASVVTFSPELNLVGVGSNDGKVSLWNLAAGTKLADWQRHTGQVNAVSISPGGQSIASAGRDGLIRVWERANGNELWQLTNADVNADVQISPNDASKVFCAVRNGISKREVATGVVLWSVFDSNFDLTPDGTRIVTGYVHQGESSIRDAATGQVLFAGFPWLQIGGFSFDSRYIFAGAKVIDVTTGQVVFAYNRPFDHVYQLRTTSPDGTKVAVSSCQVARFALAKIIGQVNLESYIGNISSPNLLFQIEKPDGTIMESWQDHLSPTGTFEHTPTVPLLADEFGPGLYRIRIKGPTWLASRVDFTTSTKESIIATLANGDANGDNVVDLTDYTLILEQYNTTPTSSNWDLRADQNGDQVVDLSDYTIVVSNFNKIGD